MSKDAREIIATAVAKRAGFASLDAVQPDELRTILLDDASAIIEALGIEQVGWNVGRTIGPKDSWYGNVGVPVYRFKALED